MSIGRGIAVSVIWISCTVAVVYGVNPGIYIAAILGTLFTV